MTKSVSIIFTGGTISVLKRDGHTLPTLRSQDLLPKRLWLPEGVSVKTSDIYQVMSESLTWSHLQKLVAAIKEADNDPDIIGIVISHGTDTMEEVAYLLDLVGPWSKPVVLTGAMRQRALPSADGEANLLDAVEVAIHPESVGRGVCVVMNQEIHAARFVSKEHSTGVNAFQSPGRGPVGSVVEGRVCYHWLLPQRERFYAFPPVMPTVELIRLGLVPSPLLLRACLHASVQGVVIEGFGAAHIADFLLPELQALVTADVWVWVVPRTTAGGPLLSTYTYPGSEGDLLSSGIQVADGPGVKARLRMMLELGKLDTGDLCD
ncbi:MAG: asparaginase [Bacilli bacterium]